jgi:hypothetical protein
MKNIFKMGLSFIVLLLTFFITSGILMYLTYLINPKLVDYVGISIPYIFIVIFFYYSLNYTNKKNRNDKSIYYWLDRLDGGNNLLLNILEQNETQGDILKNLEIVYIKLLVYTGHDLKKLRLLKGYFKSVNNETSIDLFLKLFITFLFGVFATNLSNGNIIDFFNGVTSHEINVSTGFLTILNLLMLFLMFLIAMAFIIRELFIDKKRVKVVEEILEVCIKQLEGSK